MRMSLPGPWVVVLALALAACQPARREDAPTSAAGAAAAPVASSADAAPARRAGSVILGEARYRERIKMPPGAALVVELLALGGNGPRVVATVRVPDVAGPPIPFALPYDPARLSAGGHALRATLLGPDGERWFATPSPAPVIPGEGTAVELLLRRVADGESAGASAAAAPGPRHWECGELGVMTRALPEGLRVDANARAWKLARIGGGAYADAGGASFREMGPTARLAIDGEPARDCVPARQPSPWNEALLRGIAFRAVGNEPGWWVEVDGGDRPRLRAVLDYGERRLEAALRRAPGGFSGLTGTTPLRLDITPAACADGMSGQRFEARVSLQAGEARYTGCGGWLLD